MPLIILVLTVVSLAAYNRVLTNAHEQMAAAITVARDDDKNVVFRKTVDFGGTTIGLLEVLLDEEPEDAVYQFAKKHGLHENLRHTLLKDVCLQLNCGERTATHDANNIIWRMPIFGDDGSSLGILEIPEGFEPADIVQQFATEHLMSQIDRNALIRVICNDLTCTRLNPLIWKKELVIDNSTSIIIEVEEGEEPADKIFQVLHPFDLLHSQRKMVFEEARKENVPYTREFAFVYSQNIEVVDNEATYVFELYDDGREPIDVLYQFVTDNPLEEYWEELVTKILPGSCEQVSCKRQIPLLWSRTIAIKEGDTTFGVAEVYKNQEPIDAIDAFCQVHKLGKMYREEILKVACEDLVCTRTVPVVYLKEVRNENGESFGAVEILEDEEVVDAVARFLFKTDRIGTEGEQDLRSNIYQDACTYPRVKCSEIGEVLELDSIVIGKNVTEAS